MTSKYIGKLLCTLIAYYVTLLMGLLLPHAEAITRALWYFNQGDSGPLQGNGAHREALEGWDSLSTGNGAYDIAARLRMLRRRMGWVDDQWRRTYPAVRWLDDQPQPRLGRATDAWADIGSKIATCGLKGIS